MTIRHIVDRSVRHDDADGNRRWKSLWYDEIDGSYYLCSSVEDSQFKLNETMVFVSNESGDILSQNELTVKKPAVWTDEEAEDLIERMAHHESNVH